MDNIEKLKEKVERDPSSTLFVPLAETYRKAGRIEEAIEVLRDGIDRQPTYASARVALGKIYFDRGMLAESREQFAKVVEGLPDNLYSHKKLGEICKKQGDIPAAIAAYVRAQKLNPADEEAAVALRELQTMKGMKPRGDAAPSQAPSFGSGGRDLDATQAIDPREIVFDDEAFAAVFRDGADEEIEVVGVDEEGPAAAPRDAAAPRSSISDDEVTNLLGEISVSDDEVAVVGEDEGEGVDLAEEFRASAAAADDGLSLEETVSLGLSLSEREALTLQDDDEEQPVAYDLSEEEVDSSGVDESETFSLSLAERAPFEGDEEEECLEISDEETAGAQVIMDGDLSLDLSFATRMAASSESVPAEDEAGDDEGDDSSEKPETEEEETYGETVRMPSPMGLPRSAQKDAQEEQLVVEEAPPPFSLSLAEKAVVEAAEVEEAHGVVSAEGEEPASIEELISRAPQRNENIDELASSFSLSLAEQAVAESYEEETENSEEAEAVVEESLFEPTSIGDEGAGEPPEEMPSYEAALFEPTSLGEEGAGEPPGEMPLEEAALFEPTSLGEEGAGESPEEMPSYEAALFEPTSLGEEVDDEAAVSESEPSEVEAAFFESASIDEEDGEGISLDELPEEAVDIGPRIVPEEEKTREIELIPLEEETGGSPYSSDREPTEELLEPLVSVEDMEATAPARQAEEVIADVVPAEVSGEQSAALGEGDVAIEPALSGESGEDIETSEVIDAIEVVEAEEYVGEVVEAEIVEAELIEVGEFSEEAEAVDLDAAEHIETEAPEEVAVFAEPVAEGEAEAVATVDEEESGVAEAEGFEGESVDTEVAEAEGFEGESVDTEVMEAEVFEGECVDAEVMEAEVFEAEEYASDEEPVEVALGGEEIGEESEAADEDTFVPGGIEIEAAPVDELVGEAMETAGEDDLLTPGAIELDVDIEPERSGELLGEEIGLTESQYESEEAGAEPSTTWAPEDGASGEGMAQVEAATAGAEGGLREADALIAGGDYRGAAQVYMDLLRSDPGNKEVLQRAEELGILAKMMGIDLEPRRSVEEMLRDFLGAIEKRRDEFYRHA